MSYTPTEWKSGDVITSEKLNNLEQGVADASGGGGGALVIDLEVTGSAMTLNKTWQEIFNTISGGTFAFVRNVDTDDIMLYNLEEIYIDNGSYGVSAGGITLLTDSADGYPSFNMG